MIRALALLLAALPAMQGAADDSALPGTAPLKETGDLADLMMKGLHRFVERKIGESVEGRPRFWKRDTTSREAYDRSIEENRRRLLKIIGAVDPRVAPRLERFGDDAAPALLAEGPNGRVWQVRWPVLA
ncbi:MAG TPA: hypothetical protein VJB14_06225, partial [Planctomycetota bacterium]|nr:hypothetical protein [Planctomycetota bacterium]